MLAGNLEMVTEGKYLGRLVLDGPVDARPQKDVLQRMIRSISRDAPPKNKQRVRFAIETIRPAVPDSREPAARQIKEVFVGQTASAAAGCGNEDFFRIPLRDIVSVGSHERCFCFITLALPPVGRQHTMVGARPMPMHKARVGLGRFFVQAFRFKTSNAAQTMCSRLVQQVEQTRIKDQQFAMQQRQRDVAWTLVTDETRDAIMEEQGRHPAMSPLPASVPMALQGASDRPSVCSPLSLAQAEDYVRLKQQVQNAINSPSLSPQPPGQAATAPPVLRATRWRPSPERAAQLQRQFGDALERADSTNEHSAKGTHLMLDPGTPVGVSLVAAQIMEVKRVKAAAQKAGDPDGLYGEFTPACAKGEGDAAATLAGARLKPQLGTPESGYASDSSSQPGSNVSLLSAVDAAAAMQAAT